ncbi:ATP-binding protein [Bacillus sp. EB600]|uniref:ATP-binding protein n=1 Tax=Bacillus sp. EB600 TaxID=2806345 RepID=UPI00210AD058|nr:ATP-binding protein [Bacillus sp. EB600]MCQ6281091.1 ATP-binding protein [Bacillus sp. EB600]
MNIEFPIKYFEGNLVFSQDGTCWAYYQLPGYNYDFLADEEKDFIFTKIKAFFWQINLDTHLLVVPSFQSIQEKHEHFKSKLSGPLKEAAIKHTDDSALQLEKLLGKEGTEYRFYIGVKLQKPDHLNKKSSLFQDIKEAWKEFIGGVNEVSGLDIPEITEDEINRYRKAERRVYNKVSTRLKADPINEEDLQWLIRRNWYRSIGKAPIIKNWSPAYTVNFKEYEEGKITVRRPLYHDVVRLSEGLVDDSPKRNLILKQIHEGDEVEGYVAFLTIANVPYEMQFPGEEWMYVIQNLDFPVEISVRTETMDNRKALSAVRNKQKELKDQDRHAWETGNETGLNVLEGRKEAQELEAYLQKSRMPLIKTSIILAVAATDEDELKRRCDTIKDMYQDMMFQIEQPYGDQWLAFNEFLPGAKRYIKDYVHFMEPATVAGGMFGATKQLGDGEGFFIGSTGILDQPVYIMPNRAAQGIRGTKTNALSAAFLGSLGGGKSFCANLITYLSVLSGGKALVIDPKNERGNWNRDLYELGEQVNIISLSTKPEDKGRLDPFSIHDDIKEAETLALDILTFLTGVRLDDSGKFPKLTQAVRSVSEGEKPCLSKVVQTLLNSEDKVSKLLGEHIRSFSELSFAQLLFGDGENDTAINLQTALNVLQIQNLELPAPDTPQEKYNLSEMLSIAMMLPISSFALKFIHSDRHIFKTVLLDEAWAVLNTSQGSHLASRLVRAGRSMNAGIYFVTQNANDLLDEKMKNNIGMKFAFRSTDPKEIENVLSLLNLKNTEYNASTLRELQNGQCLFQDITGRVGVISINALFKDLFDAFDTRPPAERIYEDEKIILDGRLPIDSHEPMNDDNSKEEVFI